MDWFRRHIGYGSRLALFALAIQFVLAFGHAHPTHAQTAKSLSYIELVAAAIEAENSFAVAVPQTSDDHQNPHRPPLTDTCALCAVIAMTASALFSSSPILHLPEAVSLLYRATDAGFAHLDPAHGPFQPRAPPVS